MLSSDRVRTKLLAALDARDAARLKTAISQLPSSLPQAHDPLEIANCLEQVRVAADVLIEACDSNTAFETAASTRTALVSAKLLPWAASVLNNFSFEERVVARVALVLAHLGGGVQLRGDIGAAGAVDQLTILWKSHPSCVAIVQALISLCTGHIDNISRFMRRRGITTAVSLLNNPDTARSSHLVEHIMILVGLCVICTPDNNREGAALVPAILGALKQKRGRTQTELKKHVFIAIANMAECWSKENDGYDLGDIHTLVALIVETWISVPRSREMAYASSWALAALYRHDVSVLGQLRQRAQDMADVHGRWRANLGTVNFLACLTETLTTETNLITTNTVKGIKSKSTEQQVVPDLESVARNSESEAEDDESEVEGDLTDREKSPVSIGEGSIESQTIIIDSDSDGVQSPPPEPANEPKLKKSRKALRSSPKKIPIIVLDSDSDDENAVQEQTNCATRSKEKRSLSTSDDISHTQVSTKKPRRELAYENLDVRRSKRQRKPNPKYHESSPRRHGTRMLRRTKITSVPPMVSFPFIVPPNHDCQVVDSRGR